MSDTTRTPSVFPTQTPVAMLSRLRQLASYSWTDTDTGVIALFDIEELLKTNAEHAPILQQYAYYRSNFKLFVRINTNQYYGGSLLVTNWPAVRAYGQYREQRALLTPVTISASTQQSAEINIPYAFPVEWLPTFNDIPSNNPHYVCIEVLTPLRPGGIGLSDTVEVQIFGAFVDPVLQFNVDSTAWLVPRPQSKLEITKKTDDTTFKSTIAASPTKDAATRGDGRSFEKVAPTLSSIPILGTIAGSIYDVLRVATDTITGVVPSIGSVAPLLPFILDKPEVTKDVIYARDLATVDHYASDVASPAPLVAYTKNAHTSMITGMGVKMGTWTLAQYAMLPGIQQTDTITPTVTTATLPLSNLPSTPCGYLCSRFRFSHFSVRVRLQVFTNAFTSARAAIYLSPQSPPSANVDDYILMVVDIKGDTVVDFVVPYFHNQTYESTGSNSRRILQFRLLSPLVVPAGDDGRLDLVWWTAAAPDVQFSMPYRRAWTVGATSPLPEEVQQTVVKVKKIVSRPVKPSEAITINHGRAEKQTSIQAEFSKPARAIVDDCHYFIDNRYAAADSPVTFNDVLKRYYRYDAVNPLNTAIPFTRRDTSAVVSDFPRCFGAMRGSARVKWRFTPQGDNQALSAISLYNVATSVGIVEGLESIPDPSGFHTATFPWGGPAPFALYDDPVGNLHMLGPTTDPTLEAAYFAFGDDVETGLPLLPLAD